MQNISRENNAWSFQVMLDSLSSPIVKESQSEMLGHQFHLGINKGVCLKRSQKTQNLRTLSTEKSGKFRDTNFRNFCKIRPYDIKQKSQKLSVPTQLLLPSGYGTPIFNAQYCEVILSEFGNPKANIELGEKYSMTENRVRSSSDNILVCSQFPPYEVHDRRLIYHESPPVGLKRTRSLINPNEGQPIDVSHEIPIHSIPSKRIREILMEHKKLDLDIPATSSRQCKRGRLT